MECEKSPRRSPKRMEDKQKHYNPNAKHHVFRDHDGFLFFICVERCFRSQIVLCIGRWMSPRGEQCQHRSYSFDGLPFANADNLNCQKLGPSMAIAKCVGAPSTQRSRMYSPESKIMDMAMMMCSCMNLSANVTSV